MAYSAEVIARARARLAQAKEDRESENRQHQVGTSLPELDHGGAHQVSAPVNGAGKRFLCEALLHLPLQGIQLCTISHHPALGRRPGTDAGVLRSRVVIGIRLLG